MKPTIETAMTDVREYDTGLRVSLILNPNKEHWYGSPNSSYNRLTIAARCENGDCVTHIDLLDLIAWLKANKPELLK